MNTAEIVNKLTTDLYADIEETLLCVMAAGVPANKIIVSDPKMRHKDCSVYLESNISFKP